jgi:hypothetical protein
MGSVVSQAGIDLGGRSGVTWRGREHWYECGSRMARALWTPLRRSQLLSDFPSPTAQRDTTGEPWESGVEQDVTSKGGKDCSAALVRVLVVDTNDLCHKGSQHPVSESDAIELSWIWSATNGLCASSSSLSVFCSATPMPQSDPDASCFADASCFVGNSSGCGIAGEGTTTGVETLLLEAGGDAFDAQAPPIGTRIRSAL